MASTVQLSPNFEGGFKSDVPRDEMPRGTVWRMQDILPSVGGTLPRMRSRWNYASEDLSGYHSATRVTALGWHAFADDKDAIAPKLIMLDENGDIFYSDGTSNTGESDFVATSSLTSGGKHPAILHKNLLVFLSVDHSTGAPVKVYNNAGAVATAALGGTPPTATVGASWGDYLLLANGALGGTTHPRRIWISDVGDPESWTLAASASGSFWDMPDEIVALATFKNGIFSFGYGNTWMLQGDIPPPGGNWVRKDFALGNGCMDPRSIARYKDYVIWANSQGIWKSDGTLPVDITAQAGISSYWRDLVDEFTTTDTGAGGWKPWIVSAGVYGGFLFVTVRVGGTSPSFKTLMIDLENYTATTFTNFHFTCYAPRIAGPGSATDTGDAELFGGDYNTAHAVKLSGVFDTPVAETDPDSTTIQPEIETPFYKIGTTGQKRIRRLYMSYLLAGTTTPTILAYYALTADATTYTQLGESFPTTTGIERKVTGVRKKGIGISFKLSLNPGGATDWYVGGIEAEMHALDEAR